MTTERGQLAASPPIDDFNPPVDEAHCEDPPVRRKSRREGGKPGPSVRISRRPGTSQSLTVSSAEPDASVLPSGENASEKTACE